MQLLYKFVLVIVWLLHLHIKPRFICQFPLKFPLVFLLWTEPIVEENSDLCNISSNPPTWLISPPFQTSILHTHFIVSHIVFLHILDSSLVFAMIIVSFKLLFYLLLKYRNLVKPCVVKLYYYFWIHLLMLCLVDIFLCF